VDSRVLRDAARLRALIQSMALLNIERRERDEQGRVIATLEDYDTVRSLVRDMYIASATGVSAALRRFVDAVSQEPRPTLTNVARRIGITKQAAGKHLKVAERDHYVVRLDYRGEAIPESRPGHALCLSTDPRFVEPLPTECALPTVADLQRLRPRRAM
jgi:hypothetical protein